MRFFLLLYLWLMAAEFSFAQNAPQEPNEYKTFERPHLLSGVVDLSFYSFYLGSPDIKGYAYIPNFSPRLGFDYRYRGYGLRALLASLPQREIDRRGSSQQSSFILTKRWRRIGLDLYYQTYRGLYADSPLTEVSGSWPERFPQLPDARVRNLGANIYIVLRPDSYSMSSSFDFTEFQVRNGGSWLVVPFINHLELSTGDVFRPGTDPASPQVPPAIGSATLDTLGLSAGYGHTWVSGRRFISLQATAGAGPQYQRVSRVDGGPTENLSMAVNLNGNFAAGINNDDWMMGVRALGHSLSSRLRDTQFASNLVSIQFFAGGRF